MLFWSWWCCCLILCLANFPWTCRSNAAWRQLLACGRSRSQSCCCFCFVCCFFATVTKDQHLSHGSGSLRNWVDFIWESDFVVFLLLAQRLDPEADVPRRHRPSGWRVRAWLRELVLGLNLKVRGQMKVRVMAGLGSQGGQSMQPP